MSMEIEGLSDLQKDLLKIAQRELPKETKKIMRKAGSKARTYVARKARSKVKKKTGNYHKKWKRGKAYVNAKGENVVRVINSSPHAHLIEDGHRQVTKDGREVGFVRGRKVLDQGIRDFENSGQYEKILSDWLDQLLKDGKL